MEKLSCIRPKISELASRGAQIYLQVTLPTEPMVFTKSLLLAVLIRQDLHELKKLAILAQKSSNRHTQILL